MKLPNFTQDPLLNALRHAMGAPLGVLQPARNRDTLTREEIDALTSNGIDVKLSAVQVLPNGTLAYKNSRVILYIRDIAYSRENKPNLPRFHISDCKTLEDMRANNRFERYVVATREDGRFALNLMPRNGTVQSITEPLSVCQNCLDRLQWDGFERRMNQHTRLDRVGRFRIAGFFAAYGKTLVTKLPRHDANTAPLNTYSTEFSALGDRIKAERGYHCCTCGIDLADHRQYLHAHHKNAQKHDSRPDNIAILCVACHAEQYNHGHIKDTKDYLEFIRIRSSILAASPAKAAPQPLGSPTAPAPRPTPTAAADPSTTRPSNWVAAAHEVARIHGLTVQDLRKDGGCLWVVIKNDSHPAAARLKELDFQFSVKRQAFWRKD